MIEEGKPAPPFRLEGSDGKTHSLEEYRGRKVVLYFYPRDNTPGCTKEACAFRDLYDRFQALGAVVLGVSKDSLDSHRRFIEKYDLPFVLLSDPSLETMEIYGAYGEKKLYGKVTRGVIRSTVLIDEEGNVLKHWRRVPKAADHPAKVLEFLEQL